MLLEYGADINLPDNEGLTSSGIAEEYSYPHMIKLLKGWK